ncbi:MAG: DUF3568 family protein [Planctomycetota bacterium]|nr:DUF3568 family protein [Planctomycetota bacterium]
MAAAGCSRGKSEPEATGASKQRSAFSRFLSPQDSGLQYGWDGQSSKAALDMPVDAAFDRAMDALHTLGFVVKTEESRRQGATARIAAAKADKTEAQLTFESKGPAATMVKVKVGVTGDRTGSERILDEIQKGPRPAPAKKKA